MVVKTNAPQSPYADFLVHEAAHIFHNQKREVIGLSLHRKDEEWLLPVALIKRETFAYVCEAFSRILALAKTRSKRLALYDDYASKAEVYDERVNKEDLLSILKEAV